MSVDADETGSGALAPSARDARIEGKGIVDVRKALLARYPALGYPLYRRYFLASLASVGAQQFVGLAQGWLVFKLSHSALVLGLLGAAASVPNIVLSLFGGVVADRFDKRSIQLCTSALTATLLFLLAALDRTGVVHVWHVWAIAGATALISGIEWPTRQSYFPHLIERHALLSAVALNAFVWQATRMVIPALGGVLIALTDTWFLFLLSGFGVVTMFLVMWWIPVRTMPAPTTHSTLKQIFDGLHFIWTHELFRWLILLSYCGMFFAFAYMQILPVFLKALGASETGYGLLFSASGFGSVAGTLLVGEIQHRYPLGLVLLGGAILSGLCLYGFAVAVEVGWFPLALTAVFSAALFSSIFMVSSTTALQLEVPDALRGRVMGTQSITYSLMPLGALVMGALAEHGTPVMAVALGATVYVLFAIAIALARPSIRALEAQALGAR